MFCVWPACVLWGGDGRSVDRSVSLCFQEGHGCRRPEPGHLALPLLVEGLGLRWEHKHSSCLLSLIKSSAQVPVISCLCSRLISSWQICFVWATVLGEWYLKTSSASNVWNLWLLISLSLRGSCGLMVRVSGLVGIVCGGWVSTVPWLLRMRRHIPLSSIFLFLIIFVSALLQLNMCFWIKTCVWPH